MRKISTAIIGITVSFSAHCVDIKANFGDQNTLSPIVIDTSLIVAKEASEHLQSIGLFNVYYGDCQQARGKLRQEVVCVTDTANEEVSVNVPHQGKYLAKQAKLNATTLAGLIYKKTINVDNHPFSNKISYIGKSENGLYSLYTANYKGEDEVLLLQSDKPILSPTWSPNGRYLAYVSYETLRSSIFVHDINTGKRVKVYENRGLNGYPTFKDDNSLLLSISNERVNSDIYQYNLVTKELQNLSNTKKPEVFPKAYKDGHVFVRMHSDTPYLYKMEKGMAKRIYQAPHNSPDVSSDGSTLISVSGGKIHVNRDGKITKINGGGAIESPTISGDGEIIYMSRETNGKTMVTAINRAGKKIFNLLKKNQNLIQVSAY